MRRIGHFSSASTSMPKLRAIAAWRWNTIQRSGVRATFTLPHCFQPVASPVSCSSVE